MGSEMCIRDRPNVKAGLMIAGNPICFNTFEDCLKLFTIFDFGRSKPISIIFFLNFFLSSALDIALELAPISSILYFF